MAYTRDKTEVIFTRVCEDTRKKLDAIAAKEDRALSYIVRKAVDNYIAQFDAKAPQVE